MRPRREYTGKRRKRSFEQALGASLEADAAGRSSAAWAACEEALELRPTSVEAWCHAAKLAIAAGRPEVALNAAQRAVAVDESHADSHQSLGAAQRACGQLQAAAASLGHSLKLHADNRPALVELAQVFLDAGDAGSARPFLDRALAHDTADQHTEVALGRLYAAEGRLDEAIAAFQRAIALGPYSAEAFARLGDALRDAGDVSGAVSAFEQAIRRRPWIPATWSSLLLTLQCSDAVSADELAAKHKTFGTRFGAALRAMPSVGGGAAVARRLRIGYVSTNLRRHALAMFFEPLVTEHDRSRFEICCYYNGPIVDDVTTRIHSVVDRFTNVGSMLDGHLAAAVRRDGIDILVDLDGHTVGNRLPMFFLRPAPTQVTWLGYLSTTGVSAIDYRFTDARADPEGLTDRFHTEQLWRLPRTAWCYKPYLEAGDVEQVQHAEGSVTFVCLNTPCKTTSSALSMWAAVLRQLSDSRLILHVGSCATMRQRLLEQFAALGIAVGRIRLVERQSLAAYLATYRAADIALDTWPCAGGTTTCDALWMGVPVVTLVDERSYSRTGASMLACVGLDELVTRTPEDYVGRAVALANDRPRREELRSSMRSRMRSSPLMDAKAFARDVEQAYSEMWARRRGVLGA
jgi:predicted O-linked N-acetylglucosamine transferase (SPINDLY family)